MTSTPRAARNARDEITVAPPLRAGTGTHHAGRPAPGRLTASEPLGTDGWSAAQDELAELSTNLVHREVDSSHQGLVDDHDAATESARAAPRGGLRLCTGAM